MATSWKDLLSTFDTKAKATSPQPEETAESVYSHEAQTIRHASVLFTDTRVLATKFHLSQKEITDTLDNYLSTELSDGRDWALLDVSAQNSGSLPFRHSGWEYYCQYLNDFLRKNHIPEAASTSVFILGGDDVIPIPRKRMPIEESPIGYEVEFDSLYCFKPGTQVSQLLFGAKSYGEQSLLPVMDHIQCNIGRFPIETGTISLSFRETVDDYLARCQDSPEIGLNTMVNLTSRGWAMATSFINDGIPCLIPDLDASFLQDGMFTSPDFRIDKGEQLNWLFLMSAQNADLALFNLHGDSLPQNCNYFGEDPESGEMIPAFSPEAASEFSAKVICSLACYGTRHTGLPMNLSIMLSALYHKALLFVGSCMPSFYNPGRRGFCEILVKLFLLNFSKGYSAGEALLRAKLEYLLHFWPMDRFSLAYFTISEFNLFGNPRLTAHSRTINPQVIQNGIQIIPLLTADDDILRYSDTDLPSLDDAYIEVQEETDDALMDVERSLHTLLSERYNLGNLKFRKALKRSNGMGVSGYKFFFTFQTYADGLAIVHTDKQGKITELIRTR